MPGPAPDPKARRRNARPASLVLPAGGREGPVPDWPIGSGSKAERVLWSEIWASPQAVAWEQLGWTRVVARYVRLVLEAEKRDAPVTLAGEVRQMEDRLGLTPMSMRRLMWTVGEPVEDDGQEGAEVTNLVDFRTRYG